MPTPRNLKFDSVDHLIADVQHLKKGYVAAGNWSLPQMAWHCGMALGSVKPVPPGTVSTPEQLEQKKARFDALLAAGEMPPGLPTPPGLNPATEAPPLDESAVEQFLAGLHKLNENAQSEFAFGRFGLVQADDFRRFICIHSANHLRNLIPTT